MMAICTSFINYSKWRWQNETWTFSSPPQVSQLLSISNFIPSRFFYILLSLALHMPFAHSELLSCFIGWLGKWLTQAKTWQTVLWSKYLLIIMLETNDLESTPPRFLSKLKRKTASHSNLCNVYLCFELNEWVELTKYLIVISSELSN